VSKEALEAVQGVVERGNVGFAAVKISAFPEDKLNGRGNMERRGARGWVAANLGVSRLLPFSMVGIPNHPYHPSQSPLGNPVEGRKIVWGRRVCHDPTFSLYSL
jgi:hypothetical protein